MKRDATPDVAPGAMPDGTVIALETAPVARAWWRRLVLPFGGVLLPLVLFSGLADEIHEGETFRFDGPLLHGLHAHASGPLTRLALLASQLGGVVLWIMVALLLPLFWRAGLRRTAGFWATAMCGTGTLNVAAKAFFHRERPKLWVSPAPETTWSFPSGHAMGSMAFCVALCVIAWRTRWRVPALVFSLLFVPFVAWSRAYLGVHYPSDLLAGWAVSVAWVLGARWALRGTWRERAAASL